MLDFVFTTRGRLYSLLCGLYANIFDYFWKLYSIKLKVSDFIFETVTLLCFYCSLSTVVEYTSQ